MLCGSHPAHPPHEELLAQCFRGKSDLYKVITAKSTAPATAVYVNIS